MPKPRSRLRRAVLVTLALLGVGLLVLHVFYPLPYVYRVMAYQDASFEDIHAFPARSIAAADSTSELTLALDARVAEIAARHPRVHELGKMLEETGTSAFVVVHDGKVIDERYLRGHDRRSLQNSFSVSKSFGSALVGLAIRDGVLALDTEVAQVLPELAERDERFGELTVEHLLDMRSGIRFSSDVSFPFITADNALIYYHPDLESTVLARAEIASPPGEFRYNNYNPPLLGLVLRRTTGTPPGEYLEREIWGPMGAAHAAGWTTDDHGVERMESGFHATARDLARFGLLYLHGGKSAAGRQVVPESWVAATTELPEPVTLQEYDGRSWVYRLGWWIVPRPTGRSDFCAIGRFGQFVYVSPQHDAVIVRTGPDRGDWGDRSWTELFYFLAERL